MRELLGIASVISLGLMVASILFGVIYTKIEKFKNDREDR